MPLPIIAAIAARAGGAARGAGRALKKGRGFGGAGGGEVEKPKALSVEGISMLALAGILEAINVIIGFLDFAFGIGLPLGPVVNLVGTILIGGWLWLRFKKLPLKKAGLPLIANSIPFVKFFPFWWLLSVALSLDWKNISKEPQEEEQPEPAY